MIINEHKQKYLNKEVFNYISAIQVTTFNSTLTSHNGSISERKIQNFTPFESEEVIISEKLGQTVVSKSFNVTKEGTSYHITSSDYPNYLNFLNQIYRDKKISDLISFSFLEKIVFKFIINTKRNNQASEDFCNYILDEINNSVKEFEVHFKILYLDIESNFKLGNVNFEYVGENYFQGNRKQEYYEDFRGNVLVSTLVKAEKQKAQEIAFEKCSLAVDCLKLFFDIIIFPEERLSFDIDSRTKESDENEVVFFENSDRSKISINNFRIPTHQNINKQQFDIFEKRGISKFNLFLKQIDEKENLTELDLTIVNSIKLFAKAIYQNNLNQRVVELFTQLESLVLSDSNEPILNSLTKYISKLVTKNVEERKFIITLLKEMYGIRSSYVHHAKEREINIQNLSKFQYYIHNLITILIELSTSHITKDTILKEIDDAILAAY
ncbi:HEPN domain-containing protein [Chryseobacterium indoltheticum]|jgi:hypothetical protein|uniref:HEPN domain-containing protein n=1 Tax=Chryseobacterium indoltheticum TaxID=254 RepID=UPI00242DE2F6|nr:HEPN domain-containing protein [Chryseobacterium indoltheticum]MDF2831546.1 hypothetical protein [Chryseobacterium indoltheticum]